MPGKSFRNKKIEGGSGASEYGSAIFPNGGVNQLSVNAASNVNAGANLIQANHPAQVWTGGKKKKEKKEKMGGSLLVDIAVPAALVYTNQMYPRKRKSEKSRKSRKHRKSSRRQDRK